MSPIDKQRAKVAALQAEKQKTAKEAATTRAAHTAFLTDDSGDNSSPFGSAKAAALLRKAGDAREADDAMTHALDHAEKQLLDGERAEERRVLALRWTEANVNSAGRLTDVQTLAALLAQVAAAYTRLAESNGRLYASMPNASSIDMDAGYLRQEQIAGAVLLELARLGCPLVPAIDQPHLAEHLSVKFERVHKWIRSFAAGAA